MLTVKSAASLRLYPPLAWLLEYRQSMGEMTDAQAVDIIHAAYDNGITLFDTAESYGIPNGLSELRCARASRASATRSSSSAKLRTGATAPARAFPKPRST